ncbi:MAG: tRNA (N(6)-L-threonylcarbamoyladenosine(37)-C(2))-methylthiotransferase MtaB [Chloroflexi bacterium]|nr:tRNA (N(6)-L-threonylcarbamoyladenosine(37)-C(2))-methylthiotransferase MtaB [Chloroflexota bacterium]
MKVHLRMVGCRLNQSEIETMARQFQKQGHEVVDSPEDADHFVLNSCAVTQEATKTSRKLIRDFQRANPNGETTVTGCYAQIAPGEMAALPGVRRVIGNQEKDRLVTQITGQPLDIFDSEPFERGWGAGTLGRTRAFVKVQDGCDNACTFCVTTIARGASRSRQLRDIVREVDALHRSGYQEAVLTGVHLGSYGHDLGEREELIKLVKALLTDTDLPRIRLSSLEPWDLSPDFFALWQDRRLCRHLHLPLQSGCDATLRRMRRNTDQKRFRALVNAARAAIPQVRITSDVIVGFPGETEQEFTESASFVREMNFAGLHVFRYSSRPGTPASRMRDQVSSAVKKRRSARLLELSARTERDFAASLLGSAQEVLWEQVIGATPEGFLLSGYTDNYMRARTTHPRDLSNVITRFELNKFIDGAIHGKVKEVVHIPKKTHPMGAG